MSASVAVQIDSFSLMIVAYVTAVSDTDSIYFIAMVRSSDPKLFWGSIIIVIDYGMHKML